MMLMMANDDDDADDANKLKQPSHDKSLLTIGTQTQPGRDMAV